MRTRPAEHLRPWLALAVAGLLGVAAAGCGDDSGDDGDTGASGDGGSATEAECERHDVAEDAVLSSYQEEGITIGIANERPYGFEEDGEATGEAPELGKEIFCRMGIDQVDFQVQEFGALISGLNADRFDVIAAGMFINEERAEQVLFTDPDYCAPTSFAVAEGNPEDLSDFESITGAGATLGVMNGAVEHGYAQDLDVPEDQISTFEEQADLFDALVAGRIDAVALTSFSIQDQTSQLDGFEATESFIPVIDGEEQLGCGGFAFRYDDQDVRDLFNQVLTDMQEADEVLPVVEPFGWDEVAVDAAKDVTAADLAGDAYEDSDDTSGSSDDTSGDDTSDGTSEDDTSGGTSDDTSDGTSEDDSMEDGEG